MKFIIIFVFKSYFSWKDITRKMCLLCFKNTCCWNLKSVDILTKSSVLLTASKKERIEKSLLFKMTGNLSDEDFLHVFDEMSRICGDSASIRVLQLNQWTISNLLQFALTINTFLVQVVKVWVFWSNCQAKTLGCDVLLYAVGKPIREYWATVRKRPLPWYKGESAYCYKGESATLV